MKSMMMMNPIRTFKALRNITKHTMFTAATLCVAAVFVAGLSLLTGPRLLAVLEAQPGLGAVEVIRSAPGDLNDAQLVTAMRSVERALQIQANPDLWLALGVLQAAAADRIDLPGARRVLLQQSRESHKAGLSHAVAQSPAWFRLARLRSLTTGPTQRAARAFTMSVQTAPADHSLAFQRMAFGLAIQDALTSPGRQALQRQIATAWALDPLRTFNLAADLRFLATLSTVLANDPLARRAFLEIARTRGVQ